MACANITIKINVKIKRWAKPLVIALALLGIKAPSFAFDVTVEPKVKSNEH